MKKYLIAISCLSISAYAIAKERPSLEYNFPVCGQSILNEKNITKVCATRDFTALEPRKRKRNWLAFMAAEGSSGYKGPRDPIGGIVHFENKELDMQNHVWDFSKQENPNLVLEGHDSVIKKGVILNAYLSLGSNEYLPPNFSDEIKTANQSNLYAKIIGSNNRIENFTISNLRTQSRGVTLNSWGGGVNSSVLILKNNINIQGSKTNIKNNVFISEAKIAQARSIFSLKKINKTISLDSSQQIFPDRSYDRTAIPNVLYVKFSPGTVIDGNTFTLTQKNDQAYAIVLDHSPRVRITNNTFNGFKVPILMDQWSSIVDEKGKEIKPEQFTGYGNIINPNEFAGHVTMNRKGEIVKE